MRAMPRSRPARPAGRRSPRPGCPATGSSRPQRARSPASATSGRGVYAGVVEHSVYVHPDARGQGTGRRLLDALITSAEAAGIWTIQSSIFPENTASLRLHQLAGFRVVGTRERIGRHHGRWRDTVLIERRSATAGTG
jgi:L-amino acid N-acyltransferase YncA